MSSATTPTAHGPRRPYFRFWCHSCQASLSAHSVAALPAGPSCPFCGSEFAEVDEVSTVPSAREARRSSIQSFFEQLESALRAANPHDIRSLGDYALNDEVYERLMSQLFDQSLLQRKSGLGEDEVAALSVCRLDAPLECVICQEVVEAVAIRLECGHAFHPECVKPWLRVVDTCPTCRHCIAVNKGN